MDSWSMQLHKTQFIILLYNWLDQLSNLSACFLKGDTRVKGDNAMI